jgi:hypothetical protein
MFPNVFQWIESKQSKATRSQGSHTLLVSPSLHCPYFVTHGKKDGAYAFLLHFEHFVLL